MVEGALNAGLAWLERLERSSQIQANSSNGSLGELNMPGHGRPPAIPRDRKRSRPSGPPASTPATVLLLAWTLEKPVHRLWRKSFISFVRFVVLEITRGE